LKDPNITLYIFKNNIGENNIGDNNISIINRTVSTYYNSLGSFSLGTHCLSFLLSA